MCPHPSSFLPCLLLPPSPTMTLRTEDTGKIFEMAICMAYGIEYDGKYKYSMDAPEALKPRLMKLIDHFPSCRHTAKRGARYDFTSADATQHLSAKTTKKGVGKVAPQVIGQTQPQKFCALLDIPFTTVADLKQYIQTNITSVLPVLVNHTFDCPNIYYNEAENTIRYITLTSPIDWSALQYKWTCAWDAWNNSSTLKVETPASRAEGDVALVEFQFHTKSRTNMAIRWCYESFLTLFKDNLTIVDL